MISGYLSDETWLHRIPAGPKLIVLAIAASIAFPIEDWRLLLAGLGVVLLLFASGGRAAIRRIADIRSFLPLLAIVFALHALTGNWIGGANTILRLLTMILLANLLSMTTTMQQMMNALRPVLEVLRPLGVNPEKVALALSLVIRFVPVLGANWEARADAWRARTGRRPSWRLVGPFVVETLRMADQVAEALDARGFAQLPKRRS